jgi:hypothetical protein
MNTPRTVIDGTAYEKTESLPFWEENNLLKRALSDNKVKIDVDFGEANQETLDISVEATALENINQETVIQVVCVEKDIAELTGENGEDYFDWVVRKMLPDAAGSSFETIASGETVTVNTSWKPKEIFDPNNVVIVVFAQNNITKEVYNAKVITPSYFPDIVSSNSDIVFGAKTLPVLFPNPVKDELKISLDKKLLHNIKLQIITVDGKVLHNDIMPIGTNYHLINVSSLPRGTYFIKYQIEAEMILAQKFIKL